LNHRLVLESVTHRYAREVAVDRVSLAIEEGELVTLLGPSGCGKTTLLRIVAGFVRPSEGRVLLEGRDVTRVSAYRRPVNMVFQRSTLFPHLDVFENVAFGLRIAKVPRGEVGERVTQVLALVRLRGFERRRAHELSGGQLQRVALARALVNRPKVLLLDEPLSALDLKIRLEMEAELRRVHRETGATFVYVTHDQREALALSDRLVVLNDGHVEQIGTPDEIYRTPASPFAARFVGDANVIPVQIVDAHAGSATVTVGDLRMAARRPAGIRLGPAWLVVRPEVVRLVPDGDTGLAGVVRDLAFRGTGFSYRVHVTGLPDLIKAEMSAESAPPLNVGSGVRVSWEPAACGLLPREPGDGG
jgi:ABC-type Fe3+/spermidine/putrescine transport system ATPase subunit